MATIPGIVSGNVVGSTYKTPDEAMVRMQQERAWELEDRKWAEREEQRKWDLMQSRKEQEIQQRLAREKDALMKYYGQTAQNAWNNKQGYVMGGQNPVQLKPMPQDYLSNVLGSMWGAHETAVRGGMPSYIPASQREQYKAFAPGAQGKSTTSY